jgi:hypothetical protein
VVEEGGKVIGTVTTESIIARLVSEDHGRAGRSIGRRMTEADSGFFDGLVKED